MLDLCVVSMVISFQEGGFFFFSLWPLLNISRANRISSGTLTIVLLISALTGTLTMVLKQILLSQGRHFYSYRMI